MKFAKMNGLGNDFVLLDVRKTEVENPDELALRLCDRHTGIGGDGLLLVGRSGTHDLKMDIYNSDGSRAEMCGNGMRCFAKYAYEHGVVSKKEFTVETLAGTIKPCVITDGGNAVELVCVNVGKPKFSRADIPMTGQGTCSLDKLTALNREFTVSALRLTVPHAVVFVEELGDSLINTYGPVITRAPEFPEGINVNFCRIIDRRNIQVSTYERGAGRTLACGTGSSSACVCSYLAGYTERQVNVHLRLGQLLINWEENGEVMMTGPAQEVFTGDIEI